MKKYFGNFTKDLGQTIRTGRLYATNLNPRRDMVGQKLDAIRTDYIGRRANKLFNFLDIKSSRDLVFKTWAESTPERKIIFALLNELDNAVIEYRSGAKKYDEKSINELEKKYDKLKKMVDADLEKMDEVIKAFDKELNEKKKLGIKLSKDDKIKLFKEKTNEAAQLDSGIAQQEFAKASPKTPSSSDRLQSRLTEVDEGYKDRARIVSPVNSHKSQLLAEFDDHTKSESEFRDQKASLNTRNTQKMHVERVLQEIQRKAVELGDNTSVARDPIHENRVNLFSESKETSENKKIASIDVKSDSIEYTLSMDLDIQNIKNIISLALKDGDIIEIKNGSAREIFNIISATKEMKLTMGKEFTIDQKTMEAVSADPKWGPKINELISTEAPMPEHEKTKPKRQ